MVKSKAAGKVTLGVLSQGKQNKRSKQGAGTGFHQVYFYEEATMKLCRGCGVAAALLVPLAPMTPDMEPGCFYDPGLSCALEHAPWLSDSCT